MLTARRYSGLPTMQPLQVRKLRAADRWINERIPLADSDFEFASDVYIGGLASGCVLESRRIQVGKVFLPARHPGQLAAVGL